MNDEHSVRNSYPCDLVINKWKLTSLEISQYYKTRSGREKINDELIIKIVVEKLNGKKLIPDDKKKLDKWDYFTLKSVCYGNKHYRLVCCHENNSPIWGVLNIYPITVKENNKENDKKIKQE